MAVPPAETRRSWTVRPSGCRLRSYGTSIAGRATPAAKVFFYQDNLEAMEPFRNSLYTIDNAP